MSRPRLGPILLFARRSVAVLGGLLRSQTMLALIGTLGAIALFSLGGLALDWWVFYDRYQIGFVDYLRAFVF